MNCKQFRMFRGFHEMRKVHQALSRYSKMDIIGTIENFHAFLPEPEGLKKIRVPYRENIEYILLKLQGLSKLFLRIIACCKKSASYFLRMVWNAGFLLKGTIFVANLGKIWDMSREMCKELIFGYDKIFQYKDLVKARRTIFGSDSYGFPEKLGEWLGDDYKDLVLKESTEIQALMQMEPETESENLIPSKTDIDLEIVEMEDCGVPIKRSLVAEIQKVEICPGNHHSIEALNSKKSVKKFLTIESNYRKLNPEKSVTIKKLKNKKFKLIKEDIKRKSLLMQENPFVEYVKNLFYNISGN